MVDSRGVFEALVQVVARLRAPDGCPWDRSQDHESLRPYLVEEAYEVLEALDRGESGQLREELGDLLFQILFHAQLEAEQGRFDIYDVVAGIHRKMIDRHPHVFEKETHPDPAEVAGKWEARKRDERRKENAHASVLDGIPAALPALLQAARLTDKAAKVGFDWPDVGGVREKLKEELAELEEAMAGDSREAVEGELGDVLFTLVNLSRFLKVNPEDALRRASDKFRRRFKHLEASLHAEGKRPEEVGLEELDRRWDLAKGALKEG